MPKIYDRYIVKCACRLVKHLNDGPFYIRDGEFPPLVQREITRMVVHCERKYEAETSTKKKAPDSGRTRGFR